MGRVRENFCRVDEYRSVAVEVPYESLPLTEESSKIVWGISPLTDNSAIDCSAASSSSMSYDDISSSGIVAESGLNLLIRGEGADGMKT